MASYCAVCRSIFDVPHPYHGSAGHVPRPLSTATASPHTSRSRRDGTDCGQWEIAYGAGTHWQEGPTARRRQAVRERPSSAPARSGDPRPESNPLPHGRHNLSVRVGKNSDEDGSLRPVTRSATPPRYGRHREHREPKRSRRAASAAPTRPSACSAHEVGGMARSRFSRGTFSSRARAALGKSRSGSHSHPRAGRWRGLARESSGGPTDMVTPPSDEGPSEAVDVVHCDDRRNSPPRSRSRSCSCSCSAGHSRAEAHTHTNTRKERDAMSSGPERHALGTSPYGDLYPANALRAILARMRGVVERQRRKRHVGGTDDGESGTSVSGHRSGDAGARHPAEASERARVRCGSPPQMVSPPPPPPALLRTNNPKRAGLHNAPPSSQSSDGASALSCDTRTTASTATVTTWRSTESAHSETPFSTEEAAGIDALLECERRHPDGTSEGRCDLHHPCGSREGMGPVTGPRPSAQQSGTYPHAGGGDREPEPNARVAALYHRQIALEQREMFGEQQKQVDDLRRGFVALCSAVRADLRSMEERMVTRMRTEADWHRPQLPLDPPSPLPSTTAGAHDSEGRGRRAVMLDVRAVVAALEDATPGERRELVEVLLQTPELEAYILSRVTDAMTKQYPAQRAWLHQQSDVLSAEVQSSLQEQCARLRTRLRRDILEATRGGGGVEGGGTSSTTTTTLAGLGSTALGDVCSSSDALHEYIRATARAVLIEEDHHRHEAAALAAHRTHDAWQANILAAVEQRVRCLLAAQAPSQGCHKVHAGAEKARAMPWERELRPLRRDVVEMRQALGTLTKDLTKLSQQQEALTEMVVCSRDGTCKRATAASESVVGAISNVTAVAPAPTLTPEHYASAESIRIEVVQPALEHVKRLLAAHQKMLDSVVEQRCQRAESAAAGQRHLWEQQVTSLRSKLASLRLDVRSAFAEMSTNLNVAAPGL